MSVTMVLTKEKTQKLRSLLFVVGIICLRPRACLLAAVCNAYTVFSG
jgi:hypothetical protein